MRCCVKFCKNEHNKERNNFSFHRKEQTELENISRRRYPDKWGKLTGKDVNGFYNQDNINKCIRTTTMDESDFKEIWPYSYTGHGDSYFVSKDMYEMLVAKCRCGRQRTEGHTIKCLQKVKSKYLTDDVSDREASSIASGDANPGKGIHGKYTNHTATNDSDDSLRSFNGNNQSRASGGVGRRRSRIPETSNGMIGWPTSRYSEWEQSTKYVSPIVTTPGYKVTERPYSVIFIG